MSSTAETLTSLRRLEKHWEEEYHERALGGIRAAAGFRYQYLTALLALVRSWLARPDDEKARPAVFVESLSDTVQLGADVVLVTQVKRTRASNRVREALEEFWLIDGLARRRVPELVPRLRFRILALRTKGGNVGNWIANWRPEGDVDEALLAEFKEGIETEVAPSPEEEILALLANELGAADPLGLVLKWLGALQEAAESPPTFNKALRDVWNDLQGLRAVTAERKPAGVYLWTDDDRPPADIAPGDYLTGQQPRVRHLRDGFFAPRPRVYGDVATAATQWIDGDPVDGASLNHGRTFGKRYGRRGAATMSSSNAVSTGSAKRPRSTDHGRTFGKRYGTRGAAPTALFESVSSGWPRRRPTMAHGFSSGNHCGRTAAPTGSPDSDSTGSETLPTITHGRSPGQLCGPLNLK